MSKSIYQIFQWSNPRLGSSEADLIFDVVDYNSCMTIPIKHWYDPKISVYEPKNEKIYVKWTDVGEIFKIQMLPFLASRIPNLKK